MHELKESDKEKRLQYCRLFTDFIQGSIEISDKSFLLFLRFQVLMAAHIRRTGTKY
jgi:hypothetical protein